MTAPGGYFGRWLRIDLATGKAEHLPLEEPLLRRTIGGVGLGTALLSRSSAAGHDPLGPDGCLVMAFSPLVGSPITTSAKFAIVAKSPLTERLSDALSSSDFAVSGKRTGHDAIVLRGRAARPSVVLVDEQGARLEPAGDLWGAGESIDASDARLRERFGGFCFALIGTAGERQVRYACIANQGRHAGRGGLGAVLGAMNVKAIGVRGKRPVPLHDTSRVVAIARDLAKRSLGPATEKYRELGTIANVAAFNRLRVLPTRNFQQASFEGAEALSGEVLHATRSEGRSSCRSCTIGCEHFFSTKRGKVKAEYENVFALGPLCGIADPEITLEASHRCDDLGLDTISAGGTIAFAMECVERGLLDATPWSRPELRFGRGEVLLSVLEEIATRSTPLGELLADGSRRAAACVGPPAPSFAPHVKGLELPGYEPRALQTMALGFAVGTRGADHNKSGAYEVDFSAEVNRFNPGIQAVAPAIASEDRAVLFDSLILCKFLRGIFEDPFAESAEALSAITGWEIDPDELHETAARIVLAKRRFNEREGWTQAEDTLPDRMFDEASADSGARLDRRRFEGLRAAYYAGRGLGSDGRLATEQLRDLERILDL